MCRGLSADGPHKTTIMGLCSWAVAERETERERVLDPKAGTATSSDTTHM